jgi:hypothetical protein
MPMVVLLPPLLGNGRVRVWWILYFYLYLYVVFKWFTIAVDMDGCVKAIVRLWFPCTTSTWPSVAHAWCLHNVQTLSEVNQIHPSLSAGPMGASSRATESYCTRLLPPSTLFRPSPQKPKSFQNSPSHRILHHMHRVLNIDENKTNYTVYL